jgi:hypothetical protein
MTWTWRYFDALGQARGDSEGFTSQDEAESWLAQSWKDLDDRGVAEVELRHGDEAGYRMKLTAE